MNTQIKKFFIALGVSLCVITMNASAANLEKTKVSIGVGGKTLLYYLPLTIAEQLGYFKDEGLQVEISDFAGGAKSLQALVGGSVDVVSGAYEHTISMRAKKQDITAFVLQNLAPQNVFAVSRKTMPNFQSIKDLKGKRIGVTAPGSSTNVFANVILAQGGLKPSDVSFISVGTTAGALAAIRSGQIDAIVNVDPIITTLQQKGEIKIIADARTLKETRKLFGGSMPAATLYTTDAFLKKYPNTTQALTNAMVRALKWLQKASAAEVANVVPKSYQLGDGALYQSMFNKMREGLSPDGYFPADGPATALKMLQTFDPNLRGAHLDLAKTFTNDFVQHANDRYK